jgi:hypothetical protein
MVTSKSLQIFLCGVSALVFLFSSQALLQTEGKFAEAVLIHGGGTGSLKCSDGSSFETNLSFTVLSSNSTVTGNWTLYSFDSASAGLVVGGPIYSGNVTDSNYQVRGGTGNEENAIMVCSPPLFGPVIISGTCGYNVVFTVHFRSNDPLSTEQTFSGSSDCQRSTAINDDG